MLVLEGAFTSLLWWEGQTMCTVPDDAPIEWRLQDLFTLPHTDSGHYDLVLEHTCFCAIDPARRAEWAEVAARILRPQGRLLALFYTHDRPGGPPDRLSGPAPSVQCASVPSTPQSPHISGLPEDPAAPGLGSGHFGRRLRLAKSSAISSNVAKRTPGCRMM